ncbi:MAG: hypothetical protein CR217_09415 [Beijerinckiaceae bacterium]|nr:MAG: hypothetical protein CR217_09415 [Beijerinckiaceae bacterium]
MQRAYASVAGQYDLRLVFVAGLICVAACLISMNLFIRANDAKRGRPFTWLFAAATVFGAGVWAIQFIAELAYEPGIPIGYDAGLTAVSLVAAIGAAWLGMYVSRRFAAPVLGGAMIGAGIAAMHCIGMAALRAPAQLYWGRGLCPGAGRHCHDRRGRRDACLVARTGLAGPPLGRVAARPGDCRTSFHAHGGSHSCARSAYRSARPCRRPNRPRGPDRYGNGSHRGARPAGPDRG